MKPIGTVGTIDTLTLGSRVITDFTNFKTLYGFCGTAGAYTNFSETGDTGAAFYQIPGGKSFRVVAIELVGIEVTVNFVKDLIAIGYTDTATGMSNPVEGTNSVYIVGKSGGQGIGIFCHTSVHQTTGGVGLSRAVYPVDDFTIPTGKWAAAKSSGSTDTLVILYGYEE